MPQSYQTTIIAAVVALIGLTLATVFGIVVTGHVDAFSTPLIVTLMTGISVTITSLLALLRTDRVAEKLNGTIDDVEKLKAVHPETPGVPPSEHV